MNVDGIQGGGQQGVQCQGGAAQKGLHPVGTDVLGRTDHLLSLL